MDRTGRDRHAGRCGAVVLDDESTARVVLEDWLHDYYEIDDDEADIEVAAEYLRGVAGEN